MVMRTLKLGSLIVLAVAGVATAGDNRATVLTRNSVLTPQITSHPVITNGSSLVSMTQREVVEPRAVVNRYLSNQPVHPHLIEVQVAHTTVYLDPSVDYLRQHRHSTMTERNYITAALQQYQSRTRSRARVIHARRYRPSKRAAGAHPEMILLPRPDRQWTTPKAHPKKNPMPKLAPAPRKDPSKPGKLLASANSSSSK